MSGEVGGSERVGKEGPTLWLGSCGPPRCPPPAAAPRTFSTCFLSQAVCHGHARASPPRCFCFGSTALPRHPIPTATTTPRASRNCRSEGVSAAVRSEGAASSQAQTTTIGNRKRKPPFSSFWCRFLDESFFALSLDRQAGHSSLSHGCLLHRSLFCQPSFWPLLFKTLN